MPRYLYILSFLLLCLPSSFAQQISVGSDNIGHISVAVNDDDTALPVLILGSSDRLTVEFDDLTTMYRRFTYTISHQTPDWQPTTTLFESQYLSLAPDDSPIEGYEQSSITLTGYTHYQIIIGGTDAQAIKPLLAGNYLLSVYTEGEESEEEDEEGTKPVFTVQFMVCEPRATLSVQPTVDTDIDYHKAHQQLNVTVSLPALPIINHAEELRLVCQQNRSPYYTIVAPAPTYIAGTTLKWEHCRALIFPGGNEYRVFGIPSTRVPGLHVDRIRIDDDFYTATRIPDYPYRDYYYDEDQNGQCEIFTNDSDNPQLDADYILTRFVLTMPERVGSEIFIDGQWPEAGLPTRMTYHADTESYESVVFLKQGYYSYRYLSLEHVAGRDVVNNIDGNYFQTENEYTSYLYYRPQGSRYWQLVAVSSCNYKP